MLVTWHVKPKADVVAAAVVAEADGVDEAVVEAVVVEDDLTSPHPNPRKTTNEPSLESLIPTTHPPSDGMRLLQV
jgi:hypothetical protein